MARKLTVGMLRNLAYFFAALLVAGIVVDFVPALRDIEAWMEDHELALLLVTAGMAGSGVAVLIGSMLMIMMDDNSPVSRSTIEVEPGGKPAKPGEFTFRELKHAIASGAIVRSGLWTRRVGAACGGMLMLVGVPGVIIVLAPMALKLLVVSALGYALVRIGWGIAKA